MRACKTLLRSGLLAITMRCVAQCRCQPCFRREFGGSRRASPAGAKLLPLDICCYAHTRAEAVTALASGLRAAAARLHGRRMRPCGGGRVVHPKALAHVMAAADRRDVWSDVLRPVQRGGRFLRSSSLSRQCVRVFGHSAITVALNRLLTRYQYKSSQVGGPNSPFRLFAARSDGRRYIRPYRLHKAASLVRFRLYFLFSHGLLGWFSPCGHVHVSQ